MYNREVLTRPLNVEVWVPTSENRAREKHFHLDRCRVKEEHRAKR